MDVRAAGGCCGHGFFHVLSAFLTDAMTAVAPVASLANCHQRQGVLLLRMCPFLAVCIPAALRAGASGKSLLLHSQQQNTFGVGTYLVVEAG